MTLLPDLPKTLRVTKAAPPRKLAAKTETARSMEQSVVLLSD
jgi:hypothetical protein